MSHQAVSWAWDCDLPCAQRMVLMVLGNYFHPDQPDACFPSHTVIARKAGLSRKHVITCLAELEKAGYISIYDRQRQNGGNTSCSYVLHMPMDEAPSVRAEPEGFVYVAACGASTKVGITRNLDARIKGLQTANPLPVVLTTSFALPMRVARAVEELVLAEFEASRVSGEWLSLDPGAVCQAIEKHIQDVVEGMSPEVTGGLSPEVIGGVTTGDGHNIDPVTLTTPKPPRPARSAPPPDVVDGRSVHALNEDALYVECCAIQNRSRSLTNRDGGWFFPQSVIDEAQSRLDGRLT